MSTVQRFANAALVAGLLALSACGGQSLPGDYFDLSVAAVDDQCNAADVGFQEEIEVRVVNDGGRAELYVGASQFATGDLSGCELSYQGIVWTATREEGDLRYQMSGVARVEFGGDGCAIAAGQDWEGTETYTIISSADPAIASGCTYTLTTGGVWAGSGDDS